MPRSNTLPRSTIPGYAGVVFEGEGAQSVISKFFGSKLSSSLSRRGCSGIEERIKDIFMGCGVGVGEAGGDMSVLPLWLFCNTGGVLPVATCGVSVGIWGLRLRKRLAALAAAYVSASVSLSSSMAISRTVLPCRSAEGTPSMAPGDSADWLSADGGKTSSAELNSQLGDDVRLVGAFWGERRLRIADAEPSDAHLTSRRVSAEAMGTLAVRSGFDVLIVSTEGTGSLAVRSCLGNLATVEVRSSALLPVPDFLRPNGDQPFRSGIVNDNDFRPESFSGLEVSDPLSFSGLKASDPSSFSAQLASLCFFLDLHDFLFNECATANVGSDDTADALAALFSLKQSSSSMSGDLITRDCECPSSRVKFVDLPTSLVIDLGGEPSGESMTSDGRWETKLLPPGFIEWPENRSPDVRFMAVRNGLNDLIDGEEPVSVSAARLLRKLGCFCGVTGSFLSIDRRDGLSRTDFPHSSVCRSLRRTPVQKNQTIPQWGKEGGREGRREGNFKFSRKKTT